MIFLNNSPTVIEKINLSRKKAKHLAVDRNSHYSH